MLEALITDLLPAAASNEESVSQATEDIPKQQNVYISQVRRKKIKIS